MGLLETDYFENMDAPYKDDVMDIVGNHHLVDIIAEKEIKSIKTNKEEAFYVCGDNLIPLFGSKSSSEAKVWHTPKTVSNVCGTTSPKSIHMHGPYMSVQSPQDRHAHKFLFGLGLTVGCAVGIDGMRCEVPSGDEFVFPWSDEFYDRVRENGGGVIDDVRAINCHSIYGIDEVNDKECVVYARDTNTPFRNLVAEPLIEEDNSISPVLWIKEDEKIDSIEKTMKKKTRCIYSEIDKDPLPTRVKDNLYSLIFSRSPAEKSKRKKVLSCFFQ